MRKIVYYLSDRPMMYYVSVVEANDKVACKAGYIVSDVLLSIKLLRGVHVRYLPSRKNSS